MVHELKIWPEYFQAIVKGYKTFEVRKSDRNFASGDHLKLMEYHMPSTPYGCYDQYSLGYYTGAHIIMEITYVLQGGQFGIKQGYCVLGLQPIN